MNGDLVCPICKKPVDLKTEMAGIFLGETSHQICINRVEKTLLDLHEWTKDVSEFTRKLAERVVVLEAIGVAGLGPAQKEAYQEDYRDVKIRELEQQVKLWRHKCIALRQWLSSALQENQP
jgi:hypothetical protein